MGFPLQLALRYMGSKKRSFISLGTFFAVLGVALGVAGLTTAISVTGGFHKEFRDKVLGVNAHVLILKRSSSFTEYRQLIDELKAEPGVTGIAPFTINPMMVTKGDRTATGVMLKGVEPSTVKDVLDLPNHMVEGSLDGLRLPGSKPPLPRRALAALTISSAGRPTRNSITVGIPSVFRIDSARCSSQRCAASLTEASHAGSKNSRAVSSGPRTGMTGR